MTPFRRVWIHPRPSLFFIVIILMARLNPALPEGIKIKLAVWPEEEHG
jgi:hypothetical protein